MNETFKALQDGTTGTGIFPLSRFRHRCANPACPERGKPWLRWLNKTESVEFAGMRYCCADCAEPAFEQEIQRHLQLVPQEKARPHRIPLGLLLVSRGVITSAQLQEAVRLQDGQGERRLGSWLREMGAVSEAALTVALGLQWGCPVFPLEGNQAYRECAHLLPFTLLQSAGVLPVHHSRTNEILYLAFTKRVDHTLLYAVEQMIGCRVMACVASDSAVSEAFQQLRRLSPPQESFFDSVRQPQEMARMAAYYGGKLRAASVKVARAADQVWLRFENSRGTHHLLFQCQAPLPENFAR